MTRSEFPRRTRKKGKSVTFEEWFSTQEWWHENTAKETLGVEWSLLKARGVPVETIAAVFENVIETIRNEYGD